MCKTQWVLGLLALCAGLAHSWDIAVGHGHLLEFYTNETKSNSIDFGSQNFGALAYDGVHDMLWYVEKQSGNDAICGYFITDTQYYCYIERNYKNIRGLAFDPVTDILFFSDINTRSIYWFSLEPEFNNNVHGNLLLKMDQGIPTDLAVDSCKGYVYWINTNLPKPTIERARFDGSEREVILNITSMYVNSTYTLDPHSLTIDPQTRKIYWIEPAALVSYSAYYADLDGKNQMNFMSFVFEDNTYTNPPSNALTVSKTGLYWIDWRSEMDTEIFVRKYRKLEYERLPNPINLNTASVTVGIAAKYEISLASYLVNKCGGSFCVNGTKVSGQIHCKCTPGYIGERCDVSVCDNYCFHGDCSFNDDGQPKCRCHDGYSGERCEVNDCHGFCLNNGVCSLNEADEPSCECAKGYGGSRCEDLQSG